MGRVAMIVSFIQKGGRFSESYSISGNEAWPSSRAVLDVKVLSCSFLIHFLLCCLTLGSFGPYPARFFLYLLISHPSSVHDIQLISECRRPISLGIGRVLLSPHECPIDIWLWLLDALDVAGEEAEALRFWERVTSLLVISSRTYSERQRLIESLLVRVGEGWAWPEWYIPSPDSMLK